MITFFPKPYKNEIYFSLIARYDYLSMNEGNQTLIELLGITKNTFLNLEYPLGLSNVVEKIAIFSANYTVDYFLNQHTNYPFYKYFHPMIMNEDMLSNNFDNNQKYTRRYQQRKKVRVCKECLKTNIEKYGEIYVNRIHQLPGVLVCSEHNNILCNMNIIPGLKLSPKYLLPKFNQTELEDIYVPESIIKELILFELDVRYILSIGTQLNRDNLKEKYLELLKLKGLAFPRLKQIKNIQEQIKKTYSKEFLEYFNLRFDNSRKWISDILRNNKSYNEERDYIETIIVMRTLAGSVKEFFEINKEYKPFGDGPWVCMNPFCEGFGVRSIGEINTGIHRNTGLLYGEVKCVCGFTYRLREHEHNPFEVPYFSNRIMEKGDLFISKIHELSRNKYSKDSIADMARISRPTVNKILNNRYVNKWGGLEKRQQDKTKAYKETWSVLCKENKNLSRRELAELNRAVYAWLRKYEPDWLESTLPESRAGKGNHKVDFNPTEIASKIRELKDKWFVLEKSMGQLIRRTKNKLILEIGLTNSYYNLYPEIDEAANEFLESLLDFRKRKLDYVLENEYKNQFVRISPVAERLRFREAIRLGDKELEKYLLEKIEEHNAKYTF